MKLTVEQQQALRVAAEPLMDWMNGNCHPHATAIVDSERTELMEGSAIVRRSKTLAETFGGLIAPEPSRLLLTQLSDLVDENESLQEACAVLRADLALARVQCDRLRDALATAGVQLTPHTN